MKKKLMPWAAAILLVAGMIHAGEPAAEFETMSGVISAIDAEAMTVTVNSGEDGSDVTATMRFEVDENTRILRESQTIELTELTSGDHVVVNYTEKGGVRTALAIGIRSDEAAG